MKARPFTPAIDQQTASSLAAWRATSRFGLQPSNTHLFLCFQMIQAPEISKELKHFFKGSATLELLLLHQDSKERSSGIGQTHCKPITLSNPNQNGLAKTHPTSRWFIHSASWSQSGHLSGWSRPLFVSLSAVQHRSCSTNQIKNLHFPGAQVFHTLSAGSNPIAPWKRAP